MQPLDIYNKTAYEPLEPKSSDENQVVFKFNSPQHFISWIKSLDENFERGGSNSSSNESGDSFALSKSLEDAYEVVSTTKFEPSDEASLDAQVSRIRKSTMLAEEGYEIDMPEYLSGAENVWLRPRHGTKPSRIIDDTLIIDAAYNAGRDAETTRKIGVAILESIYRRRVVPRKVVIGFCTENMKKSNDFANDAYLTTIDVGFTDLNGVAKMLHPATFRRMWFRLVEIYPDLTYGYGNCRDGSAAKTSKGYISIHRMYNIWENKDLFEKEIETFLGLKSK